MQSFDTLVLGLQNLKVRRQRTTCIFWSAKVWVDSMSQFLVN